MEAQPLSNNIVGKKAANRILTMVFASNEWRAGP
jgi:hypothetical protein